MLRRRPFLIIFLPTLIIMLVLSLNTSFESLTTQPYVQAQGPTHSNSTADVTVNSTVASNPDYAKAFDILSKMVQSVCNSSASNKSSSSNESLTYLNPYYGIIMQYPSNWNYKESEGSPQDSKTFSIVTFSQSLSSDPNAETNLKLWVEKLDDPAISLDDYAKNVIRSYRESGSNFKLVTGTSTNSTLSNGSPAYEIVFTDNSNNSQRKSIEVGTLSNISKSAYYITYNTDASLYEKFRPLLYQMINSFELYDYPRLSPKEPGNIYIKGYNDGLEHLIPPPCLSFIRANETAIKQ